MVRGTFWSAGQVIMSAVAGIDIALWDLKGKRLGAPVYDLLGGPTRERVRVYRHLAGASAEELVEDGLRWQELGFTALRFGPLAAFDERGLSEWDPQAAIVQTIAATEALRAALGDGVDLLLDAHTMFSPAEAAYLGQALEPYPALLLRGPDPSAQSALAAPGAREGEPPDRDRRAVRPQVGVPAADRERAGRLSPHRHGPRGRDHRGEEDPRQPARCTGSAPRCITRARR